MLKDAMLELEQRVQSNHNGNHDPVGFQEQLDTLMSQTSGVVIISQGNLKLALLGLFAQGHLLLEDLLGVGKTLLAKTIASSLDGTFARIQCTPVLLPSDITGTLAFDLKDQSFEFVAGPIFNNSVLADELNRAGPWASSTLIYTRSTCCRETPTPSRRKPAPAPPPAA